MIIYSLYTFKEILRINPKLLKKGSQDQTQEAYLLINFIELNNKVLLLWTSRIIFFYSLSGKNYKLYQTIEESNLDKLIKEKSNCSNLSFFYFDDIIEIKNGNLVLCSYIGIKVYTKKKEQYNFKYYYPSEYYLQNILKIESNKLILFQSKKEIFDFLCADTFFKISIFDTNNKIEKTLETKSVHNYLNHNFDFLIKGYNLFVITAEILDIYDLKNNIKIFSEEWPKEGREYHLSLRGRRQRRGSSLRESNDYFNKFLCNYDDNYFIAKNEKGIIKLYKFEDNYIKSFKELELDKFEIKGIKNIKKNNYLIYNENNIKMITIK